MCFVDEEGYRLITSRKFLFLTTNRFYSFSRKDYDRKLRVSITFSDGEFILTLINTDTGEETELSNPKNTNYSFDLRKGNRYRLHIVSKKACGSYRISVKGFK